MEMKMCMNISCGTTSSAEWKTGWSLRSGELANLCDKCGYAFEHHIYCEEFHSDESGWRNCGTCFKRLHCGCIASLSLIELLDSGGVKCIGCAKQSDSTFFLNGGKSEGSVPYALTEKNTGTVSFKAGSGSNQPSVKHDLNTIGAFDLQNQGGLFIPAAAAGLTAQPQQSMIDTLVGGPNTGTTRVSTLAQSSMGFFQKDRLDVSCSDMQIRDHFESPALPNLNINLDGASRNLQFTSGAVADERERSRMFNLFHQGLSFPSSVPTTTQLHFSPASDTNVSSMPQLRVPRPPGEGRGRQLLPRYWPRITDQELQQISGDSNCTVTPLFEKQLSPSDAGRIGRLVLPKACAEAYFPPISHPEGLPMKIQDVNGREWTFQFRFWPNNNSRMYVLEGVTPCIQSMQLQAGDTVTFSRKEPGGNFVMGFRKGLNSASLQVEPLVGNFTLLNNEDQTEDVMLPTSMPMMEPKKSRNTGSKSKRLLIDSQEVQALRLTWDEVQGMLRPPHKAQPTVVVIEDYEIEEYEEPPIFGKSSIFTARSNGVIEQWAQCDNCFKWRRLPSDFLLPSKWTCAENASDPTRCFCSAAEDLSPMELEYLLNLSKDSRKKKMLMSKRTTPQQESNGLSALADAAVLGDNPNGPGTSSVAVTTKHPRHREGCSCIVCIQPPSGKGKHKPTCTCTVCMTVKRRFKTLMMRKKKKQSDQEALMALRNHQPQNTSDEDDEPKAENNQLPLQHHPELVDDLQPGVAQYSDGQGQNLAGALADSNITLDLNFHPGCEQDLTAHPLQVDGEGNGHLVENNPSSEAAQKQVKPSDRNCEPVNTDNQLC